MIRSRHTAQQAPHLKTPTRTLACFIDFIDIWLYAGWCFGAHNTLMYTQKASKLADALNHDQGKVLGLLMSESSLVDDLVHVVKLDSGKDGMDTGAPPAATLAAAAAVADVTIAPMATDQIE